MTPSPHREVELFTLSDLKSLFLRVQPILWKAAYVGVGLGLSVAALRSRGHYEMHATFIESTEAPSMGMGGNALQALLLSAAIPGTSPQLTVVLRSQRILKALVERLGLQAELLPGRPSFFGQIWQGVKGLVAAEVGVRCIERESGFFHHVRYEGENFSAFYLRFITPCAYEVFSVHRDKVAEGQIGQPLVFADVEWTLERAPSQLQLGRDYFVELRPWASLVKTLRKRMKILPYKRSQSIYDLSLFYPQRMRGQEILNAWMEEYRSYLQQDHDALAEAQLSYLEKRRTDLYQMLEGVFTEHTAHLKANLEGYGYVYLQQETERLFAPYQEMTERLMAIDVELAYLQQHGEISAVRVSPALVSRLQEIYGERDELLKQRDLLGRSFWVQDKGKADELLIDPLRGEVFPGEEVLSDLYSERSKTVNLASVKATGCIDLKSPHIANIGGLEIDEPRELSRGPNSQFWTAPSIEGVDLEGAQILFGKYNAQLDESEVEVRYLRQLLKGVPEGEFEVSSLGAVLLDPVSQALIQRASEASFRLKDEKNHSAKEESRLQEELTLQKKLLAEHLAQLIQVKELVQSIAREKMEGLRTLSLECIHRHLLLLDGQLSDLCTKTIETLVWEKELLQEKMKEFRTQMGHLPEKWCLEKLLDLKMELGMEAMHALAPLVEAKTVNHHLHSVVSKPLDQATLPTAPMPPYLILFSLAGAGLSSAMTFFGCLLHTLFRGFPVSREKLLAMNYPVAGSISPHCHGIDLDMLYVESLRALAITCRKRYVTLISGRGPNYSYGLAELLGRAGQRVLLIQCDFLSPYKPEEGEGLMQWFAEQREVPLIRKEPFYDWVARGGVLQFGTEGMLSRKFQRFLADIEPSYDRLLVFIRAPLEASEAQAALSWSQQILVTVRQEPMELLTPFVSWAYHGEECRLSFVTCDE